MTAWRPSSRVLLVVAFVIAQVLLVAVVLGMGHRVDELVRQHRLDVVNDCVRERRDARELELETVGLEAIVTPPGPHRDALTARLREPARPAEELFREDFAWCTQALAG